MKYEKEIDRLISYYIDRDVNKDRVKNLNKSLGDLGIDSLDLIDLEIEISNITGYDVDSSSFTRDSTLKELYEYIDKVT